MNMAKKIVNGTNGKKNAMRKIEEKYSRIAKTMYEEKTLLGFSPVSEIKFNKKER